MGEGEGRGEGRGEGSEREGRGEGSEREGRGRGGERGETICRILYLLHIFFLFRLVLTIYLRLEGEKGMNKLER